MPVPNNQNSSSFKKNTVEPLKVLLTWQSPSRLFKKKSREHFATIGAIVFLVAIILVFLQEWFLIAVIVALVFFAYVLSTVQPEEVEHQITNKGIVTNGRNYFWEQLQRFWFEETANQAVLSIDGQDRLPIRLVILLNSEKKEEVKKALLQYLPEDKPEKTWTDKAGEWISRQIPLEK